VIQVDGNAVTTSLAIAEGTEVQHKNVMELVRTYLADLQEFGLVTFEMRPFETAGGAQQREIAILNEQHATLILTYMRNSDIVRTFKKRLIKAFWDMARKLAAPSIDPMEALSDPSALRGLLLTYSEKVINLEKQVETLAPKAASLDRIATSDGGQCVTDAAKALQARPRQLFLWLNEHEWIYRRPGSNHWVAYQAKIQEGVLEHKVTTVTRGDGTEKTVEQVRVTPKGLAKLSREFYPTQGVA
jgi:phage antirepressor YoqD-like protein